MSVCIAELLERGARSALLGIAIVRALTSFALCGTLDLDLLSTIGFYFSNVATTFH